MTTPLSPRRFSIVPPSSPRKKPSALGAVHDILGGPPAAPSKRVEQPKALAARSKPKKSEAPPAKGNGKMASVYFREESLRRVNDAAHTVRNSNQVSGAIGISLICDAGLVALEQKFEEDEDAAIALVADVAEARRLSGPVQKKARG